MHGVWIGCLISLLATAGFSRNFTVSGTVQDSAGNTIEGATVWLGVADVSVVSGADGTFVLTGGVDVRRTSNPPAAVLSGMPFIDRQGTLSLDLAEKSPVLFSVYSVNGQLLYTHSALLAAGRHALTFPTLAQEMYLYRIAANGRAYTGKWIRGLPVRGGQPQSVHSGNAAMVAETPAPEEDVLLVVKDGYRLARLVLPSVDTAGMVITLMPLQTGTVSDIEGNVYRTVVIGSQEWTVDNFRTTKFNDGDTIPLVADSVAWAALETPGYCYYNNSTDSVENNKWGALYNWYAVHSGKLAPEGWHVPTYAEWDTLQNYLMTNGYNYDGSIAAAEYEDLVAIALSSPTDWEAIPVIGAPGRNPGMNNGSGFSGLPGGHRLEDGSFDGRGLNAHWWSASEATGYDVPSAWDRVIYYYFWYLGDYAYGYNAGSYVRLVRDR